MAAEAGGAGAGRDDYYTSTPFGRAVRFEDHLGPDMLHGVSRYEDYPDGTDFSDADLDPDSEAVGRYVRVCAQLEVAIYRARSELDLNPDMTFAFAEHKRKTRDCIKELRTIAAEQLPDRSRERLLRLLDQAERWLALRHRVVHGVYRKNHRTGRHEGRRFVPNKVTKEYNLVREPYDRNSLMLAMTRASNTAADIFDGTPGWHDHIWAAERQRIHALGTPHPLRIEGEDDTTAVLHALARDGDACVCGRDASAMRSFHDATFEGTNRKMHCQDCQRITGL